MRMSRIKLAGQAYYHVVSHLVAGTPLLDDMDKEFFRRWLRAYEIFSGVHVLTYAILGSHFHILLEVPEREQVDEQEIVRRMRAIYTDEQIRERLVQWEQWRRLGQEVLVQRELDGLRRRMYDLSEFMKTLKQRFTQGYNHRHLRRGTLWEQRFKSILVEASEDALSTMSAYIDLNPVRAGLVRDPQSYRWCGYAEALGGNTRARQGLQRLMAPWLGEEATWEIVQCAYRVHIYEQGQQRQGDGSGVGARVGISAEVVERVLNENGRLSRAELLRCRVRYFSDGVALGSRDFVNGVFEHFRSNFGPKRNSGARALRFGDWGGLCSARDLKYAPIAAPRGSG